MCIYLPTTHYSVKSFLIFTPPQIKSKGCHEWMRLAQHVVGMREK
jgi:hypothetical protein